MTALTIDTSEMDTEFESSLNNNYGQQNSEGVTKHHTTFFTPPPSTFKVLSLDASVTEAKSSGTLAKATEANVVSIIEFHGFFLLFLHAKENIYNTIAKVT